MLNPPRVDEESLPTGVSPCILQEDHAFVPLREHETLRPPSEGLRVTQLSIFVFHGALCNRAWRIPSKIDISVSWYPLLEL